MRDEIRLNENYNVDEENYDYHEDTLLGPQPQPHSAQNRCKEFLLNDFLFQMRGEEIVPDDAYLEDFDADECPTLGRDPILKEGIEIPVQGVRVEASSAARR